MLDFLEPGYRPLFERAVAVFEADERVRALWLSGSLARGEADAMSDLDLIVTVRDADLAEFAAGWRDWLAEITPTLIARELPFAPGSLHSVGPGRERLDVVVEKVSALPVTFHRTRLAVFDHDGLAGSVPAPDEHGPRAAVVADLVEEFFRDYGLLPVATTRQDWLLALEGIHLMRGLLYRLFVEMNAPLPPMGVKQWSRKLTKDQRLVLEALPAAEARRESVLAANEAVAVAFVQHARRACDTLGVAWPDALEDATCAYLRGHGLPALEGARSLLRD